MCWPGLSILYPGIIGEGCAVTMVVIARNTKNNAKIKRKNVLLYFFYFSKPCEIVSKRFNAVRPIDDVLGKR